MLYCEDTKNASVRHAWQTKSKASGFLDAEACTLSILTNKNYRHHAYREYIEYIHGLLGKRYRKVIPSFAVWYIKSRWPGQDEDDK